jgi:hypothetical protein
MFPYVFCKSLCPPPCFIWPLFSLRVAKASRVLPMFFPGFNPPLGILSMVSPPLSMFSPSLYPLSLWLAMTSTSLCFACLYPRLGVLAMASPLVSMFLLCSVLYGESWLRPPHPFLCFTWPLSSFGSIGYGLPPLFFLSVICQSLGNIGNGLSTPVYVLPDLCPPLGVSAMASHPCMFHPASVNHLGILAMTSLPLANVCLASVLSSEY